MVSHAWQTGATGKQMRGRAVRRGDEHRFDELVLLHQEMVYNVAYRLLGDAKEAADVTEQALLAAYKAVTRVDGGLFKLYMLRLVTGACSTRLRRAGGQGVVRSAANGKQEAVEPAATPGAESAQRLQAGILTLPAEERIVLVLADVLGLSYGDIGQVTNLRRSTVNSRLGRGRARLRDYLLNSNDPHDA
jgi:RNA polymerase sigma-70 factor (ECF subfamily)